MIDNIEKRLKDGEWIPKQELIEYIQEKYRGVREGDLDTRNPLYSCVLCNKDNCINNMTPRHACEEASPLTEEEFALRYNFAGTK